MKEQIEELLREEINPVLARHRGGCELVEIKNDTAYIKLTGSCCNCPGKRYTFNESVIPYLKQNVENLKEVILL